MTLNPILNSISYHAVYDASIPEALAFAKANGFSGIQIADESPHLSFENLSASQADEIKRTTRELGVYIVLHAVDDSASLFQPNRHLMAGIREYYAVLFEFANRISARLVTIHAGEMVTFRTDSQPEQLISVDDITLYKKVFQENLEYLLRLNKNSPVQLCIENYNLHPMTLEILDPYLENGDIFLCWDIAKSHGQPELENFFSDHLPWINQVHLHDLRRTPDGKVRSHCVIGTGEIDFAPYLSMLSPANVQDFCIEVRTREKARESLEALKQIISSRSNNSVHADKAGLNISGN